MAYDTQTWVDGPQGNTPLSAARLTHIEDGIAQATTATGTTVDPAGFAYVLNNNVQGALNDLDGAVAAVSGLGGTAGQPRFSGVGAPGTVVGANPNDLYLDTSTGDLYRLQ